MSDEIKTEVNGSASEFIGSNRGGRRFNSRFGPPVGRPRGDARGGPSRNKDSGSFPIKSEPESPDRVDRVRRFGGGPGRGGRSTFTSNDRDEGARNKFEERIIEKLAAISGSTTDLPQKEAGEKKFSSRCRLYVGNLGEMTEEEVQTMFKEYGEINECFVNSEKQFAFVRLDFRVNAERAKRDLDSKVHNGKTLKVRFAPVGAAIKVRNLSPWVTNELLEYAFSVFGDIENARVLVDERGHSLREGIIEFARKPMALFALKQCTEGCFFLTESLRPVIVEPYDVIDDLDGFPEKSIVRKPVEYMKAREIGPRFAAPNSFEYEYGTRWKHLYDIHRQKDDSLKKELKLEEEKLEAQMEYARYEHETEMLRQRLRQREMDRDRQKQELELKQNRLEERIKLEEEILRRQAEELSNRMLNHDDDLMRRKRENVAFMQNRGMPFNHGDGPPALMDDGPLAMDMKDRFDGDERPTSAGHFQPPMRGGPWGGRPRASGPPGDFKRRRV